MHFTISVSWRKYVLYFHVHTRTVLLHLVDVLFHVIKTVLVVNVLCKSEVFYTFDMAD